jgi:hypothetical protein
MSDANVQTIRAVYDAFARGDIPTVLAAFDPQIEWREADNFLYAAGNPYVGPQAVLEGVFLRLANDFDGFAAVAEQVLDAGDTVVACGRYRGTYKKTGTAVDAQFAHFFNLRDGKVARFQQYTDTAQFAEAAAGGAP